MPAIERQNVRDRWHKDGTKVPAAEAVIGWVRGAAGTDRQGLGEAGECCSDGGHTQHHTQI